MIETKYEIADIKYDILQKTNTNKPDGILRFQYNISNLLTTSKGGEEKIVIVPSHNKLKIIKQENTALEILKQIIIENINIPAPGAKLLKESRVPKTSEPPEDIKDINFDLYEDIKYINKSFLNKKILNATDKIEEFMIDITFLNKEDKKDYNTLYSWVKSFFSITSDIKDNKDLENIPDYKAKVEKLKTFKDLPMALWEEIYNDVKNIKGLDNTTIELFGNPIKSKGILKEIKDYHDYVSDDNLYDVYKLNDAKEKLTEIKKAIDTALTKLNNIINSEYINSADFNKFRNLLNENHNDYYLKKIQIANKNINNLMKSNTNIETIMSSKNEEELFNNLKTIFNNTLSNTFVVGADTGDKAMFLKFYKDIKKEVNDLRDAVLDEQKRKDYIRKIFDENDGLQILGKLVLSRVAWIYYAVCLLFKLHYKDTGKKEIEDMSLLDVFTNIPSDIFTGLSEAGDSDVINMTNVNYLLDMMIRSLNNSSNIDKKKLMYSSLQGLQPQYGGNLNKTFGDVDYQSIANAIKHNNYMLYNYAVNTLGNKYNVNKYTAEIHGGADKSFFVTNVTGAHPNLKSDKKGIKIESDLNVSSSSEHTKISDRNVSYIVNILNRQLEALKLNGKKLSDNSYKKVKNVIKAIIDSHNDVNQLLTSLDTYNAYSKYSDNDIRLTEGDNENSPYDKTTEPFSRLEEAIKRKNKNDLRGTAISQGLSEFLKGLFMGITGITGILPSNLSHGRKTLYDSTELTMH